MSFAAFLDHVMLQLNRKIVPQVWASDSEASVAKIVVRTWNNTCSDGS